MMPTPLHVDRLVDVPFMSMCLTASCEANRSSRRKTLDIGQSHRICRPVSIDLLYQSTSRLQQLCRSCLRLFWCSLRIVKTTLAHTQASPPVKVEWLRSRHRISLTETQHADNYSSTSTSCNSVLHINIPQNIK